MKLIEKFILALIVFYFFQWGMNIFGREWVESRLAQSSALSDYTYHTFTSPFYKAGSKIIFVTWLFVDSKKRKENAWIWSGFGLFFGIHAVVLFYLFPLAKDTFRKNEVESGRREH